MTRRLPIMSLCRHRPWPLSPVAAPRIDSSVPVEEQMSPHYYPGRFYPASLGQVLNDRYQLATKLGHGANSTVWLARDLNGWRWSKEEYVAIKINAIPHRFRRSSPENEMDVMKHIARVNPQHKGWPFIRKLSDSFSLKSPAGNHLCLVLEALREPLWLYRERYIDRVIPPDILKVLLRMILHALDHLHSECHIIHADLKPDNIMIKVENPEIFSKDAKDEYDNPLPQKHSDGRTFYISRNNYGPLQRPTGIIQLVDFDLSVRTQPGQLHTGAIQGEIYRAPEVILDRGYSFPADIWSLGIMLWDLLQAKALFNPTAPGMGGEYDDGAHLGQITALIGPAPQSLLSGGQRTSMFYHSNGELKDLGLVPSDLSFESSITCMKGEERARFIEFVKRMIKWRPEERSTAKELLDDAWLYKEFPQD